jgi:hypothetical protein
MSQNQDLPPGDWFVIRGRGDVEKPNDAGFLGVACTDWRAGVPARA